jgi:hypothetical protein
MALITSILAIFVLNAANFDQYCPKIIIFLNPISLT